MSTRKSVGSKTQEVEIPNIVSICRGEVCKIKATKYSDVTYRFSFGPREPIVLTGVSFLGLSKTSKMEERNTTICIEIEESTIFRSQWDWGQLKTLMHWQPFYVTMVKEQPCKVMFPYPIAIPKALWVDIGFEIKDVVTETLKESVMNKTELKSDIGEIIIDVTRSRQPLQLSELHLLLPP